MKIRIRKMNYEDLNDVVSLDQSVFPNPWPPNAFKYELTSNSNARLWVVENLEDTVPAVIAFAVLWIILDEAHIGTIAIRTNFQGKGIGLIFLAYICKGLLDERIEHIFLEVRASNQKAISLYKKLGFVYDGERKNYYRDNNETAVLMSSPIKNQAFYDSIIDGGFSSIDVTIKVDEVI